jgi:DNA-binding transcriptional regulator GbsR (MarR family)
MKDVYETTKAGQEYKTAYAAHYKTKNLQEALELYKGVLATHPETQEAGYSREQIRNIVKSVVPEQKLLDAGMKLASAILAH